MLTRKLIGSRASSTTADMHRPDEASPPLSGTSLSMGGGTPTPTSIYLSPHAMVRLTATAAASAAVEEYCQLNRSQQDTGGEVDAARLERLSKVELGSPIEHADLIEISKCLVRHFRQDEVGDSINKWRLDALLKGAIVYRPPPTPKPEPVCIPLRTAGSASYISTDTRVQSAHETSPPRTRATKARAYDQPSTTNLQQRTIPRRETVFRL